jgi:hypothetical protein
MNVEPFAEVRRVSMRKTSAVRAGPSPLRITVVLIGAVVIATLGTEAQAQQLSTNGVIKSRFGKAE